MIKVDFIHLAREVVLGVVGAGNGRAAGQAGPAQPALGIVDIASVLPQGIGFADHVAQDIIVKSSGMAQGVCETGEVAVAVEGEAGAGVSWVDEGDELSVLIIFVVGSGAQGCRLANEQTARVPFLSPSRTMVLSLSPKVLKKSGPFILRQPFRIAQNSSSRPGKFPPMWMAKPPEDANLSQRAVCLLSSK